MSRAGKHLGHFNSDLIFVSGIPMVVIEWKSSPQGDPPAIRVPLDPAYLHEIGW
jgi:hypothetical protein